MTPVAIDSVALAGVLAAVLSGLATLAGIWIAQRAQHHTNTERDLDRKREYLSQLQSWSADINAEKDRMLAAERVDCDRRLDQARQQHRQEARGLELSWRAKVHAQARLTDYWQRAADGRLEPGEQPPPSPD
jgi:hypothetical protein